MSYVKRCPAVTSVGIHCPVCGGAAVVFQTADPEAAYSRCTDCGLRFQVPTEREDGSIYAEVELPREREARDAIADPAQRAASTSYYQLLDRDVLRDLAAATRGRRLLDVGSGMGRFLASAAAAGYSCSGVDISVRMAEIAQAHSGVPVHVGEPPYLHWSAASFDVVNLDFVLAYVPQPAGLLEEVARLLVPGGVCRIREFMADSLNGRLQGGRWWPYGETTLRVYSRRSIHKLADACGLQVARSFPGCELSYPTWRAWTARKKPHPLQRGYGGYWLKKAAFFGLPLAGDCVFHLRKP